MNYSIIIQKEAHRKAIASSLEIIYWSGHKSLKQIHYYVLMNLYKTEKNLKTSLYAIEKCLIPNKAEMIASIKETIRTTRYKIRDLQFSEDDDVDEDDLEPWEYTADLDDIDNLIPYQTSRGRKLAKLRYQEQMERRKEFEREINMNLA
jgi:hypothetical protein